jgi:steroid 5-alpha reductase family enzyme
MFDLLMIQAIATTLYASLWFVAALKLRKNDIADIAWGITFIYLALVGQFTASSVSVRGIFVLLLVTVWGLRLALHIGLRNRGKAEDPRYLKWRSDWGSHAAVRAYFQIFLLQGFLSVIILAPVTYIQSHRNYDLNWRDALGTAIWLTGFAFEFAGDFQLARFKKDPRNRGRIITSGLWKYTRHPNYFGEVTMWWGLWVIACSIHGGWITIFGPATITILILFVSGIPLLEKRYEANAEFREYRRRTSAFFPLPPKP